MKCLGQPKHTRSRELNCTAILKGKKLMISNVGFIGAGKVGTSLGKYFSSKGIKISGYYSKTELHAAESADFTNSNSYKNLTELAEVSDAIFVTVPDDHISHVWKELSALNIEGRYVVHCSGAMSSKVFSEAEKKGVYSFSLHPLFPIRNRFEGWEEINNAYFTVEGNKERIDDVKELMIRTGNNTAEIESDAKIKYHAASVFISNLVIGLAKAGQDILGDCGLPSDFSENAWKALFMGNAENMVKNGLEDALTGPVERNDYITVEKHLESLEGSEKTIYKELSRMILDIARDKHPKRDYTNIDKELIK